MAPRARQPNALLRNIKAMWQHKVRPVEELRTTRQHQFNAPYR